MAARTNPRQALSRAHGHFDTLLAGTEVPLVAPPVGPEELSVAFELIVLERAFVTFAVVPRVGPLSGAIAANEVADITIRVCPDEQPMSCDVILQKFTFVAITVGPTQHPLALP